MMGEIWMAAMAAFCIGVWLGKWSADHEWRSKGAQGFPRVHRAGRLYWVNADDVPCFRCMPQTGISTRGLGKP